MFENFDGRTDDGRTTDGRTTDAGVTGILIAHLGAYGSGELIKIFQQYYQSVKNVDPELTVYNCRKLSKI